MYTSLIRSLFEYASPVFVGMNQKLDKKMRKMDKRAHKIMLSCATDPYDACNCHAHNIRDRRISASENLFHFFEVDSSHPLFSCVPKKLSRSNKFSIPCAKYDKYHSSFFLFMARHLNGK